MLKYTYVTTKERVKITSGFYITARYQVKNRFGFWITRVKRYYDLGLLVNPTDEIIKTYKATKSVTKICHVPTYAGNTLPIV